MIPFKKLFTKKFAVLALLIIVAAGIFLTPFAAQAVSLPSLNPADWLLGGIYSLLKEIPLTILQIGLGFLNWTASGDFIKVSATGTDNPVVTQGWGIARDLANVALIFGLVIIAISIIIGYQETRAKKALVNFILIAILINFTPFIAGIVIDGANLLMRSLLSGGVPADFVNAVRDGMTNGLPAGVEAIPALVIFFIFSIIAAILYFLYGLLFMVRYVMLWILVIVSPVAFATKVFPESKYIKRIFPSITYWDDWWESFIQWTVLGIPAALSIYLSNILMKVIVDNPQSLVSSFTASGEFLSSAIAVVIGSLFAYAIPFVFLFMGFFITMDSGGAVGKKFKDTINKNIIGRASTAITGAAGAATGYVVGRGKALGGYAKGGVVGTVGGLAAQKNVLTKQGREEGRVAWQGWKQRAKETIVSAPVIGRMTPVEFATTQTKAQKEAAEYAKKNKMTLEDYGKFKHRLSTVQREAYEEDYIKNNVTKFLNSSGGGAEYQARMDTVMRHDDKSKEYELIKTKAVLDARYKNTTLAGPTNWETKSGIDLSDKIPKLSSKDLADSVSSEAISDPEFFASLRTNQIKKIMDEGSGEKMDKLNDLIRVSTPASQNLNNHLIGLQNIIRNNPNNLSPEEISLLQKKALAIQGNIAFIANRTNPRPTQRTRVRHP
ncbi:MAG: hypothetical protein PHG23_02290 [Candidatus Pacebacteria bacterium]|nr:hypothetical protein [Candidatus Paceibacterota bacterium]